MKYKKYLTLISVCLGLVIIFFIALTEVDENSKHNEKNENFNLNSELENEEKVFAIESENEVSIIEKIKMGDFSILNNEENEISMLEKVYEPESADLMWVQKDLNGDNIQDLILQEVQDVSESESGIKRIYAIISCAPENVKCVMLDLNDMTNFDFLTDSGILVTYGQHYGQYKYQKYSCFTYDENWVKKDLYKLEAYQIDSLEEFSEQARYEMTKIWKEKFGVDFGTGEYYGLLESKDGNSQEEQYLYLTKEEFVQIYEEVVGTKYNGL